MEKFKAYRIREVDKKIIARFEELALEDLDQGEVVVRVAYSSVNYKDALAATGAGKIVRRFPCVGGIDISGTVTESIDPRFKRGDAVICTSYDLGVAHDGGYAEYARIPANWALPMPKGMSLFESMALGTAGYTAGLAPANGPVIVSGATGGVGSIAIDILSRLGYHVVALTGKDGETDYLRKLGAKEVLSRKSLDLSKIKPLDRATWAGAIDNLGGEVLAWMASTMMQDGTIAAIGLAASMNLNTTVAPFILRGVSLLGIDSGSTPMPLRREIWGRLAGDMRPQHLKEMTRTIPFDELARAFDGLLKGAARGRIVVDMAA